MAVITRSADITILVKNSSQRTDSEQERIHRGLPREVALDLVCYVPASAALLLLTIKPMLPDTLMGHSYSHALLGMIAYAFPFAAFKKMALFAVLRSLSGFMTILSQPEREALFKELKGSQVKKQRRSKGADGNA